MMLQHDFYYKDQSHLPFEEKTKTNYDIHWLRHGFIHWLISIILLAGKPLIKASYDFATTRVAVKSFIKNLRMSHCGRDSHFWKDPRLLTSDIKDYVDTDDDIRLSPSNSAHYQRAWRSVESVILNIPRWLSLCHQFIEPTKRYADIIVQKGCSQVAIDLLIPRLFLSYKARP